jgi:protein CpxP
LGAWGDDPYLLGLRTHFLGPAKISGFEILWPRAGKDMARSAKAPFGTIPKDKLTPAPRSVRRITVNLGSFSSLPAHRDRNLEKLMKRTFYLLLLMASSIAFAAETGVQQSDPTLSETAPVGGRSAHDNLNQLAKRLSLTEEQKSKILPIIVERRRKIQEVWNSSTLFVRQKQIQVRGITEDSDKRISALLTGDQQKAYAALEQERKIERRFRRSQSEPTTN